jgi:hypothetical protein
VRVHNTGSFIPPEDLPHIFDRFYRVDKSRSRDVAGSGLGLAIAREITDRHGGTIRVESDPQLGTTFIVTLPATASASGMPEASKKVTDQDDSAVVGARPGLTPGVAPAAPAPPVATATAARRG